MRHILMGSVLPMIFRAPEDGGGATEMGHRTEGGATIISKLSLKTMGCEPALCKTRMVPDPANPGQTKLEPGPVPLARIIGRCSRFSERLGPVDMNNPTAPRKKFIGLSGNFEGINLIDGTIFQSGVCYLPDGIQEQVAAFVKEDGSAEIVFAIEVESYPSSTPAGYSYRARPIEQITPKPSPLLDLRAKYMTREPLAALTSGAAKEPVTIDGDATVVGAGGKVPAAKK